MKAIDFNIMCLVLAVTVLFTACFYPTGAHAQEVCTPEEKPHYYVATGTVKTTVPNSLVSVLTANEKLIWTSTFRTFSVVSPAHSDLAACNEGLEMLRAQRAIAIKAPIHAVQSLSYEGFCIATEICP